MKDKIEIETYRGQTIFYDVEADKFTCSISVEDNFKETKRQSLVAVRKEIDTFVKLNLEFKPFKVVMTYNYSSPRTFRSTAIVSGIRTDGTFVLTGQTHSRKEFISAKDLQAKYAMYDQEAMQKYEAIEEERDAINKATDEKICALVLQLKPVDISRYVMPEPTTNQPEQ